MIAIDEEVKSVVEKYRELRLRVIEDLRKLDEYSLILFSNFLRYLKDNKDEEKSFQELLDNFLTNELGLSRKEASVRLSLIRRFYNLAGKKTSNEKFQESLIPYLE
ncbi:MAG: hypothetical protein QXE05_00970 [Nitrososphaeria archaeon]